MNVTQTPVDVKRIFSRLKTGQRLNHQNPGCRVFSRRVVTSRRQKPRLMAVDTDYAGDGPHEPAAAYGRQLGYFEGAVESPGNRGCDRVQDGDAVTDRQVGAEGAPVQQIK